MPFEKIIVQYNADDLMLTDDADPDAVTATVAALAGYFTRTALLPPPPGLPTLREFADAQGKVALACLRKRNGWD